LPTPTPTPAAATAPRPPAPVAFTQPELPPEAEDAAPPPPPRSNGPLGLGYVRRAASSVGGTIKDLGHSARGYLPF
jgi:hypothetical protein